MFVILYFCVLDYSHLSEYDYRKIIDMTQLFCSKKQQQVCDDELLRPSGAINQKGTPKETKWISPIW